MATSLMSCSREIYPFTVSRYSDGFCCPTNEGFRFRRCVDLSTALEMTNFLLRAIERSAFREGVRGFLDYARDDKFYTECH